MKTCITYMFVLSAFTCFVSGCSHFNKPQGSFKLAPCRISIHTQPAGADVIQLRPLDQASIPLGKTPIDDLSVSVITHIEMQNMPFSEAQELMKHNGNVVVRVEKEGYLPYYGTLKAVPGDTRVHHVVLTAQKTEQ